ncbi:hypothetical protein BDA96_05G079000 [Sorghum bicolor]|uniref:Uncharacterized protein n=1 Tax=Sorghum bicolor TaxID=4558 RepID=A0A921QWD1_SORBI|nr:hypothetical protein BDA96_05G079000 [Sorghum bicolor]
MARVSVSSQLNISAIFPCCWNNTFKMFQLHHHNLGVVIYFCCCNIYVHSVSTASTHCCSSSFYVVAIT